MIRWFLSAAVLTSTPSLVQSATLAQMKDRQRVLVIATPSADDPRFVEQRRWLAGWRQGAADRDIVSVELVGRSISGSDDQPATIRKRLAVRFDAFAVVLIGKDGHVALRSDAPLSAQRLEQAIDSMPMRKAGLR